METPEREAAKKRHAKLLRDAIAGDPARRSLVMDATGRGYRTVGNWISRTSPTMPSEKEKQAIRDVLGDYDAEGDAVERAVFASELTVDRAYEVVGFYQRQLRLQREEAAG